MVAPLLNILFTLTGGEMISMVPSFKQGLCELQMLPISPVSLASRHLTPSTSECIDRLTFFYLGPHISSTSYVQPSLLHPSKEQIVQFGAIIILVPSLDSNLGLWW